MLRLNGKEVSAVRRAQLKSKLKDFCNRTNHTPGLAVVLVGDDPASHVYVGGKIRACAEAGINSFEHRLPVDTTSAQLKCLIEKLNDDIAVDGILVQLPLPKGLDSNKVLGWIDPDKDVDGLTPSSMGHLWLDKPRATPCTPSGVMAILNYYNIAVEGLKAVVVGRSNIVGKPMAYLLTQANATVTICHSKTKDLPSYTRDADIVVVAAGKPQMLGKEDFKRGSIVIDVGIHHQPVKDGKNKLFGDVRFEELEGWVKAATPVPGGVGPMTISMLLENTLHLAELNHI